MRHLVKRGGWGRVCVWKGGRVGGGGGGGAGGGGGGGNQFLPAKNINRK